MSLNVKIAETNPFSMTAVIWRQSAGGIFQTVVENVLNFNSVKWNSSTSRHLQLSGIWQTFEKVYLLIYFLDFFTLRRARTIYYLLRLLMQFSAS